jgi:hypothetical protein
MCKQVLFFPYLFFTFFFLIPSSLKANLTLNNSIEEDTSLIKSYAVKYSSKSIQIDGKLSDPAWKLAQWTNLFVDIEGDKKPKPLFDTKVKMLWDSEYLYIGAYLKEPDLWATLTNPDDIIFRDHDFEVFIDPNNDENQYFEIEINTLGTVMDLFMFKSYRHGGPMDMNWNSVGMKKAVTYIGTLNDNRDKDKGWYVEMAIPYACLKKPGRNYLPQTNAPWRINFSRVEWTMEKQGIGYTKKKQANGNPIPEFNWVWSPIGMIDMHIPNRWGYLHFIK